MKRENALNYYRELQINPGADESSIRRAFRTLARRYHPDIRAAAGWPGSPTGGNENAVVFRRIREAYEILIDPLRRRVYDAYLEGHRNDPDTGAAARLPGRKSDERSFRERLLKQFNYILWDIEDIINSPDTDLKFTGGREKDAGQWLRYVLWFMDYWVLEPAGYPDYFFKARNIEGVNTADILPLGFSAFTHNPYADLKDYFYALRRRCDDFMNKTRAADLSASIPGHPLTLLDSAMEAQKLSFYAIGAIRILARDPMAEIPEFSFSLPYFKPVIQAFLEERLGGE